MTKPRLALLAVVLTAFFLRVWQLPQIPPGLWYDEAYYSMDATWLLDGGPWRIFFAGNNGREPIFIYLQVPLIWLFGAKPLTSRLLGPVLGVLTIALTYALARRLGRGAAWSYWLPYLAAAGLAVSFWHIDLSRSGFRGILLPLAAAFVFYAFWRGWSEKSFRWLALAGVGLGLSQYTYLAARVLPLVFGLFALAWPVIYFFNRRSSTASHPSSVASSPTREGGEDTPLSGAGTSRAPKGMSELKLTQVLSLSPATLWLGLILMAVVSALVFAPLGWFFYQNPEQFSARTGDVLFAPDSTAELFLHLSQAVCLFIDGGDPGWRHNFQGRPMLGWLGWLGFWPGLFVCLRRLRRRQPACLFLVVALLTLYLPALVSVPPVHALRLSALLPIYYIIFAIGLNYVAWYLLRITANLLPARSPILVLRSSLLALILTLVIIIEAGLTCYDYFYRWANREETYVEYNGPLVDFVNEVMAQSQETPVIIPFHLYIHPTTRYLLHDHFTEQPPPPTLSGPAHLVTLPNNFRMLNVANIPELPTLVWLAQGSDGLGVAYVSRPPRANEQAELARLEAELEPAIYRDRFDRELAHWRSLTDTTPLSPMFTRTEPQRTVKITWTNLAQLVGYEVTPEIIQPGRPITLNLYWRSLTDQTFDYRLFLQIIDAAGKPINQWEGEAFREDMYRWRPHGILPTQHTLWLGPNTPPGPYLIRLGFFDDATGQRLPLQIGEWANSETAAPLDQVELGLFYVSPDPDGRDPRQPAIPLSAAFADSIQLTGVTLPEIRHSSFTIHNSQLPVVFHWQALHPTDRPYTVFLQLLNEHGEVVSSWDSQPFNGLYPTSLWSPGEFITDTFELPLPDGGLPPGDYRLITGFYDFETGQRLPVASGGDFTELVNFFVVE